MILKPAQILTWTGHTICASLIGVQVPISHIINLIEIGSRHLKVLLDAPISFLCHCHPLLQSINKIWPGFSQNADKIIGSVCARQINMSLQCQPVITFRSYRNNEWDHVQDKCKYILHPHKFKKNENPDTVVQRLQRGFEFFIPLRVKLSTPKVISQILVVRPTFC